MSYVVCYPHIDSSELDPLLTIFLPSNPSIGSARTIIRSCLTSL